MVKINLMRYQHLQDKRAFGTLTEEEKVELLEMAMVKLNDILANDAMIVEAFKRLAQK